MKSRLKCYILQKQSQEKQSKPSKIRIMIEGEFGGGGEKEGMHFGNKTQDMADN